VLGGGSAAAAAKATHSREVGDPARAAEEACQAARNNPFELLDEEVAELEALTARRRAVTG